MPLYLLAALAASLIPVGAVAIKKVSSGSGLNDSPLFAPDGSLIVPVGRYTQKQQPDTLTLLALAAGGFYLAKQMKVV